MTNAIFPVTIKSTYRYTNSKIITPSPLSISTSGPKLTKICEGFGKLKPFSVTDEKVLDFGNN